MGITTPWSRSSDEPPASDTPSEETSGSQTPESGTADPEAPASGPETSTWDPAAQEPAASYKAESASTGSSGYTDPAAPSDTTPPDETGASESGTTGDPLNGDGMVTQEPAATTVLDDAAHSGRHAKDDSFDGTGSTLDASYAGATPPAYAEGAGDGTADGVVVEEVVVVESADAPPDGDPALDGTPASSDLDGVAPATGSIPSTDESAADWSEIKALFVDDPAASVQRASALVGRAVEDFMASLRQRQDSLGGWQEGDATGTEEMRTALRGYHSLFNQLEQMSGQFGSGSGMTSGSSPAGVSAPAGQI